MTVNKYFKSFNQNTNEQDLVDSVNREAIQIYGFDVYYIPRTLVNEDYLFGEDPLAAFESYHVIEMYLDNYEGFPVGSDLLSKFGLNIADEAKFQVSRPRFQEETDMDIPLEGDLIYMPMAKALFEIKFVEDEEQFYPLGRVPVYKLDVELFKYSSQEFDTGIDEIDSINNLDTGSGGEDIYGDNTEIETEADEIIDFSEANPFGEF